MSRDDIQKLLGGYATDTLTEAERRQLLEAALEDQELFDALAREQGLRDVLQDPAARAELLASLAPQRNPFWRRRPAKLAFAGGLAILLAAAAVMFLRPKPAAQPQAIVADAIAPRPIVPLPQASPAVVKKPLIRRKAAKLAEEAPVPEIPPAPADLPAAAALPPPPAPAPVSRGSFRGFAAPRVRTAATAELPLAYRVLLANPDGTYAPAPAGNVLHAGDSVRLQIEPPSTGYLYLYEREPSGNMNLLASQPVEKSQPYVLPASGGLQSAKPAQLELLLLLAPQQQSAMSFQDTDGSHVPSAWGKAVRKITLEFR